MCLPIIELDRIRRKRRKRRRTMTNQVFRVDRLLGAMTKRLNEKDKEKNSFTTEMFRYRKEGARTCNE